MRIACYSLLFALCALSFSPSTASAATYTLTINTNGNGSVARNPTNSVYPGGSVVTLTALPASGWAFAFWSGDASGTNSPLNVAMDTNKVITANFSQIQNYTLTVNVSGNGSVSPSSGTYQSNALVSLTATASNGWIFHHWSGDAPGAANPLAVVMNADKIIGALFAQPPTITAQPSGGSVNIGASISLSASATGSAPIAYQWLFNGVTVSNATAATLTLSNVQPANGGNYQLLVSSPYGIATSIVAVVTVNCPGTNVVSVASDAALRTALAIGGNVRLCFSGTVTLTNTININRNVTLDASGTSVVLSGGNAVRLFNVNTGVTLMMTNVVLAAGRIVGTNGTNAGLGSPPPFPPAEPGHSADGAGIFNDRGTVRLVGCMLRDHSVVGGNGGSGNALASFYGADGGPARGAAVFNNLGTIELGGCLLTNNSAVGGAGGLTGSGAYGGIGGTAYGGAIFNNGGTVRLGSSLAVSNSIIGGRGGDARGGVVYSSAGSLTMTNCFIIGNRAFVPTATAAGGAIFEMGGTVILDSTEVKNNVALGGDSLADISATAPGNASGGALYAQDGFLSIVRCNILMNEAIGGAAFRHSGSGEATGGAVYNRGILRVADTRLATNRAVAGSGSSVNASGFGGGLYNANTAMVERVLFDNNLAKGGDGGLFSTPYGWPGADGFGGGIFNLGAFAMTNCTLTLNAARGGSPGGTGANSGSAFGGGIFTTNGTTVLMNTTVASNSVILGAYYGGGGGFRLGANIANTNATFTLRNSLVAYPGTNTTNPFVPFPGTNANVWGTITDGGYNMCSDGSANFSSGSSFNFTDPKLLPLADNGGPTLTMALTADSPAIDWAPASGAPTTDQRGVARPYGTGVDLGAFEVGPGMPSLNARRSGTNVNLSFVGQAGVSYRIQRSPDLMFWETQENTGVLGTNGIVTRSYPATQPFRIYRLTLDF